jgi:hypothetical protein
MAVEELPQLLEDMLLGMQHALWVMCDGAPAHFTWDVEQLLDSHYSHWWIRQNRSVLQPLCSPDVTPSDVYLWCHLRGIIYSTESTCGTGIGIDWRGCDNIQRFILLQGLVRHSNSQSIYRNFCKHCVNIKVLLFWTMLLASFDFQMLTIVFNKDTVTIHL